MKEYRYELHSHTSETSRCGKMSAAHVVDLYHENGYDGLCVTDHLHETYIEALPCHDDWQACVTEYLSGYRASAARAAEYGMDSILGVEIRFPENDRDYLLFGVDEAFLRRNPYLYRMGHQAFFERFHDEILILHAHPYRNFAPKRDGDIYYDCIHGVEIANCNPRHESNNAQALALCKKHPELLRVCGSDTHQPGDEARSAILFDHRVSDSFALRTALLSRNYRLSCGEFHELIK